MWAVSHQQLLEFHTRCLWSHLMVNVHSSAKTAFCYSSVKCSCSWANTRRLSLLTTLTLYLWTALLFLRPLNTGNVSPLYSMHATDRLAIRLSSLMVDAAKPFAGSNAPWPCWLHFGESDMLQARVLRFRCLSKNTRWRKFPGTLRRHLS